MPCLPAPLCPPTLTLVQGVVLDVNCWVQHSVHLELVKHVIGHLLELHAQGMD